MSNVTIDLSPVVDRVNAVARLAEHVSQQVETVSRQHQDTRNALDQLVIDFRAFVAADILAKEIQRAETKIISVRQEIDKKFGHYDVVRRRATGIMQATDVALVRQETMQVAGEQTMLDAPRYWLAPALVAMTAWITDNSTLARRAVTEAMRRDDNKTTLFMTLVCRRFGRQAAVDIWLKRYFQQQTPFALDREAVTLLDAMTNGVFGVGATAQCVGVLQQWLADQVQQVGFFNEQRKRWAEAMVAMTPGIELNGYPTLACYGKNWQTLSHCLAETRLNQRLIQHFSLILDHEIVHQERLTDAVDDILMSLVANFDDEELVLRREERALQLIVEKMGDVSAARVTASLENKTLDEKMSFAQLLTNAVMFPEQSKATLATRKLALGMSREWIEPAFADVIAASRARVPTGVDLVIHDWTATTTYGDDEKALVASFDKEMKRRTDEQLALIKDNYTPLVVGGLLALGSLALHWLLFFLIAGVGFYLWWTGRANNVAKRDEIRRKNNEQLIDGNRIISAACAEGVDFRRQLAAEDAKAPQVTALLNRISPESAIFARAGSGRAVLN